MRMFRSSYAALRVAWHRVVGLPAGRRSIVGVLVSRYTARVAVVGTGVGRVAVPLVAFLAVLAFSAAPALAAAPTIVSESAPSPKAEEVRLEATVNAGEEAAGKTTECRYQFGETTASKTELSCEQATIEGGEQGIGLTVPGLKQNTTYHYRLVVKNATGEMQGTEKEVTTALRPEAPVTLSPAQSVTATSAVLEGTLNPGVSAKDGWFFDFSNPGGSSCAEGPATALEPEVTGEALPEHTEATGLEPSMKYLFCMVARNEAGETERSANEVSFTTSPSAPTVDGQSESSVTPFDATLEGLVNPNNQETTYHLEYATDSAFTENVKTLAYGIAGPGVYGDQPVGPVDLGGTLTPATTYYYRVVARNATGEVKGTVAHPVASFTTLTAEKPSVTGERLVGAAGGVSDTIEAQLNPEFQGVASCEVQYVTKAAYEAEATKFSENVGVAGCSLVPPAEEFGAGGLPVPFTAMLGELKEDEAYEYRVVASNATGTFYGAPQALLRTAPQITGAPEVSEITQHTALIEPSTIDPEIEAPLEATYYILYGTGEAGELLSARTSVGSGLAPNPAAPVELHGLAPGTTYHYAVVAYNGNATTTGPQQSFTTSPAEPSTPPVVGSQSAQFVNENSAVIEAEINPGGAETTYAVQYGTTTAYGSSTPGPVAIAPATSAQGTITALTGLAPGTTYHYRIVASNGAGTGYGPDATFTTTGAARTSAFTSFTIPTVPLIVATPAVFPVEGLVVAGTTPKALTRAQKLKVALKVCRTKDRGKGKAKRRKREACEKGAQKRYGPVKKSKKGRK
jgi:hypothetical protein